MNGRVLILVLLTVARLVLSLFRTRDAMTNESVARLVKRKLPRLTQTSKLRGKRKKCEEGVRFLEQRLLVPSTRGVRKGKRWQKYFRCVTSFRHRSIPYIPAGFIMSASCVLIALVPWPCYATPYGYMTYP
ncbi:hypothetical protein BDY19DRAFT_907885 [Irpex rosettiformis]|uniref:Uncharacterized protein n=1 Tax=Irpex rosettiformis TaxID=378272 RepID=A0ACB8TYC9_9APHY|nr:hypothetical protein BDY19DRAFT_907885 [Irpex rosettiformis]